MSKRPVIIIVGGGFGGLQTARGLARADAVVVVVDKRNYHLFQPLLYQVASAVLSPADIAKPIRSILGPQKNTYVVLDEVKGVDLAENRILVSAGSIHYDYLVLAAGATHSYFGNSSWQSFAPGLKTIEDATSIRRRILLAFEAAELESDESAREARLTFVVVGGGPTGIELAGALREIAMESIPADFRLVDTRTARVVLVEGGNRLLGSMSEKASARAKRDLEEMGVEVRLNTLVTAIDEEGVLFGDERLATHNVLWAAGVKASPIGESLGTKLDRAGRVVVEPDLSVPGHPNAFVIGDMASVKSAKNGKPVPGVAQGALQMGKFVAGIIRGELKGNRTGSRPAFSYLDKGNMATIGKSRAVADVMGMSFGGFIAWVLWSFIHVLFLVGFRRKLFVLLGWAWNYIFQSKGARLITGDAKVDVKKPYGLK